MERTFRNLMAAMLFGSVFSAGTAPYVITCLLKDMGASLTQMSLIPFIIQSGGCAGFPIACLLARMESKPATILPLFLGRGSALFIAALLATPFCRGPSGPALVILLYALSVLVSSSAAGPANAWLKEILPSRLQSSFLGKRNAFGGLVAALLTPLFGLLVDRGGAGGAKGASIFLPLMSLAILAGFLDLYFLNRVEGARPRPVCSNSGLAPELLRALANPAVWKASLAPTLASAGFLWLAPFSIVLCFEFGMGVVAASAIAATSALGLAAGMVHGGKLADVSRSKVRAMFIALPLLACVVAAALFIVSLPALSGKAGACFGAALAALCLLPLSVAQGMLQSAQLKYSFDVLRSEGTMAFSALAFLQNLLSLLALGASIAVGSLAAAHIGALRAAFFPGFHYLHLIFLCSAASGLLASLALTRVKLYEEKATA